MKGNYYESKQQYIWNIDDRDVIGKILQGTPVCYDEGSSYAIYVLKEEDILIDAMWHDLFYVLHKVHVRPPL